MWHVGWLSRKTTSGSSPVAVGAQVFPICCLSGLLLAATSIGPAFGFITGSFMLGFYVDFDKLSEGEEGTLHWWLTAGRKPRGKANSSLTLVLRRAFPPCGSQMRGVSVVKCKYCRSFPQQPRKTNALRFKIRGNDIHVIFIHLMRCSVATKGPHSPNLPAHLSSDSWLTEISADVCGRSGSIHVPCLDLRRVRTPTVPGRVHQLCSLLSFSVGFVSVSCVCLQPGFHLLF